MEKPQLDHTSYCRHCNGDSWKFTSGKSIKEPFTSDKTYYRCNKAFDTRVEFSPQMVFGKDSPCDYVFYWTRIHKWNRINVRTTKHEPIRLEIPQRQTVLARDDYTGKLVNKTKEYPVYWHGGYTPSLNAPIGVYFKNGYNLGIQQYKWRDTQNDYARLYSTENKHVCIAEPKLETFGFEGLQDVFAHIEKLTIRCNNLTSFSWNHMPRSIKRVRFVLKSLPGPLLTNIVNGIPDHVEIVSVNVNTKDSVKAPMIRKEVAQAMIDSVPQRVHFTLARTHTKNRKKVGFVKWSNYEVY